MTEFRLVLETVQNGKSCINLFDKIDKNGVVKEELVDVDGFEVLDRYTEYLLYLDAEQPLKERKVEKKAEIIVVVDKSGSMQGTPWKQVQSALIKMLDITREVNNCQAIAYNHKADKMNLSGSRSKDKSNIQSIRAGGSTNFVAVFKELEKIFQNEKDSAVPYYIFMMTDGEDTCNNNAEIMLAKEHLQTVIERFGGEVIFNVLGFGEHHNEDFLESLALIGTSDGSYNFVSPNEGDKALEERLVALVQSTSNNIGRMLNIDLVGQNVEFLGDWFGEVEKEVILPAKMSKKEDKIAISTRKFVRVKNGEEPKLTIQIHEKLIGDDKPQDATISSIEKIELTDQKDIDAHNLKKLRSGMNLVSARLADTDKAHEDFVAKAAYELIKLKMDELKNVDENSSVDVKRLAHNVKSMVLQSGYVFQPPATSSEKERVMRSKAMRGIYSVASGQQQNLTRQMKKTNV